MRHAVYLLIPGLLAGQPAVTWYDHVLPFLQKRCLSCHVAGGIGRMALGTYNGARPWAAAIRESVKLRRMPPWFADRIETSNDSSMSYAEGLADRIEGH